MNTESSIQNISIESIIPNRFQPRLSFDEQALSELSESIKEHGIIQPLVLRRVGDKYEIIAGERRYKAATMAGYTEVPAIITHLDDNTSAEVALAENVQRKNLSSIEEAKSYKKILDRGYLSQEELSKRLGVSQPTIANKLRLLSLTEEVQEALLNDKISERHARSLLQIKDPDKQKEMLQNVITNRLTVRALDEEIKNINGASIVPEEITEPISLEETPVDIPVTPSYTTFNPLETPLTNEPEEIINVPDETEIIKKETTEAEDVVQKPVVNNILNMFEDPSYPSLEDEATNLATDELHQEEFNPFNFRNSVSELEEPVVVTPEPPALVNPKAPEPEIKKRVEPNNLDSVKTAIEDLSKEIEEAGYQISTEDFDFEDLYQMIIKIDKTNK